MENKLALHTKSCAIKTGRRFFALLLVCVMLLSLAACGGEKAGETGDIKPVTVERESEPQSLQTANEATAIALRQYIYARIATEAFLTADASSMTMEELSETADELLLAWENAELFSVSAQELTNRAVLLLETHNLKQTSAAGQPQARFTNLASKLPGLVVVAFAAEGGRKLDPQTWAENLTKQYDSLKGAKRYQQLADQLETDAKTAYEQMVLAQKIIRNAAELEEADGVVNAWTESINYLQGVKTTSKVAMLGLSMVATGGGSVTLLEGAGFIAGGIDCAIEVADTGSTIILGEGNQVAVAFGDIKEKLGPVSSLIGLSTLNPSGVGKTAKDTTEALVYITDSLLDLFYEDKIIGIKVEGLSEQAITISGEVFEAGEKTALEAAGFLFPETTKTLLEIAENYRQTAGIEVIAARVDALVTQMAELERMADIAAEALPDPDSAESAPPQAPTKNATIFGTYTCVSTNESKYETDTDTITLRDKGNGTLIWIAEDGDETHLSYDQATNIIHTESEGLTVHIEFSLSRSMVTGSGYMSGTFWDEPVETTFALTKISD